MATDTTETTTETKVTPDTTDTTTVERQGEVVVDSAAEAATLDEQSQDDRLDAAKAEALANHRAEHANDGPDTTPIS